MDTISSISWDDNRRKFVVRLLDNSFVYIDESELSNTYGDYNSDRKYVKNLDKLGSKSYISSMFVSSDPMYHLRCASIKGYTTGMRFGTLNVGDTQMLAESCCMGYDIECEERYLDIGQSTKRMISLPLPNDNITCASIVCSCGYTYSTRSSGTDSSGKSELAGNSRNICNNLLKKIIEHKPIWLFGYNCFTFDNTSIFYHCSEEYKKYFKYIKVKSLGKSTIPMILFLDGINNVDLYLLIQLHYRNKFDSLRLSSISESLNIGSKLIMPEYISGDMSHLILYNMYDSEITYKIALKMKVIHMMLSLTTTTRSPLVDVVRYTTSSMSSCLLSSQSLERNILIEWLDNPDTNIDVEGGHVINPKVGLHRLIVNLDFKSLYPSIMLNCNISHDNVYYKYTSSNEESFINNEFGCNIVYKNKSIYFPKNPNNTISSCIRSLLDSRSKVLDNAELNYSLKVSANSIYGTLCYNKSPLYSPHCAIAITYIGRLCLKIATKALENIGALIIYGDTDSCFICMENTLSSNSIELSIEKALHTIHESLNKVGLDKIRMVPSKLADGSYEIYNTFIMVGKKNYCYLNNNNKIIYKGLSPVRKDKSPIVKNTFKGCVEVLLKHGITSLSNRVIEKIISISNRRILNNECTIEEISVVRRILGNECYVYPVDLNSYEKCPILSVDPKKLVKYDTQRMSSNLLNTLDSLLKCVNMSHIISKLVLEKALEGSK